MNNKKCQTKTYQKTKSNVRKSDEGGVFPGDNTPVRVITGIISLCRNRRWGRHQEKIEQGIHRIVQDPSAHVDQHLGFWPYHRSQVGLALCGRHPPVTWMGSDEGDRNWKSTGTRKI